MPLYVANFSIYTNLPSLLRPDYFKYNILYNFIFYLIYLEFLLELISFGFGELSALLSLLDIGFNKDEFAGNFFVSNLK